MVVLNGVIAGCYVLIATLIGQGLVKTGQVRSNPLALATATIFVSCAIHHAHHALHLVYGGSPAELAVVRATFGEWHGVAIDALGAMVAMTYLGLRRTYRTLLNTPAMFDDAVRVAAEKHWRERAFTDSLTGIPNRAAYQQYADELAVDPLVDDVAVVFIDLDGFKQVNDQFGHDAGDRLLHDLAQRLTNGLGAEERVYRLGGDEFVLLRVVRTDLPDITSVVRRVRTQLAAPSAARGGDIRIGASVGTAVGPARLGVDRLLRQADAAMYQLKGQRPTQVPGPRFEVGVAARAAD